MRQLALSAAALAMLGASTAYGGDEGLDLEITMRVLGEVEDAAAVMADVKEALRQDGSSRRGRRRAAVAEEPATPRPERPLDDHRALLTLDDQLEGELDDQN